MPVMDGFQATQAIREKERKTESPRTPIIALTAHAMKSDRDIFLSVGMDDYITKPVKEEFIAEAIERVMNELNTVNVK